ncbi:non-homologous end-joining factor 1 isoform X2 [Lingula anatina]|uniref:Non-homologous end-joining factor 1 n=1 Tax=Lingula anatina TaxID=7574 RepID=A0A1S3IAT8_LINAN|nr:non-homologous end-joining factor 1 isoform X2 [Lingula anatina]|eukprot:XP_013395283.1 non-homologous end-joining factor 1 isoform X2 [Lingula anatina]
MPLMLLMKRQIKGTALPEPCVDKLNPNMEAPVETLLEHIRTSMEDDKEGTKYAISFVRPLFSMGDGDGSKVLLTLSGLLEGVPFVWKFHLQSAHRDLFYDHMTKSLLTMVTELMRRQEELVQVIKSKDKEIEDYKTQGVRTSRKHIETAPFDETAFLNNMVNSQGFEDTATSFLEKVFTGPSDSGLRQLYRDIAVKQAWLERPTETKEDDEEENFAEDTFDNNMETAGDDISGAAQSFGDKRLPPSLMGEGWQRKSPAKSDGKQSTETTPVKDAEQMRREALERRLAEEEEKKEEKTKKKKKLGL